MCFDGGFDLRKSRGNEYKKSPFWDYRSSVIKGEMKDEPQNSQRWLLTFMEGLQIWEKHRRYSCISCGTDKLLVIGGCDIERILWTLVMYHHVTTIWQILTGWNSWLLHWTVLHWTIRSYRPLETEFNNHWVTELESHCLWQGNCRLCCCNQVLHLCSQTSFDMDGQETWIFCGSSRDSYLFLQSQWVSNAVLGCSGATMAALSLSVISPFVQYLIHI